MYYSSTSSATYQTGEDTVVRGQFVANGSLANSQDTNFRAIQDNWYISPLLSYHASTTSTSTDYSLAYHQIHFMVRCTGCAYRPVFAFSQDFGSISSGSSNSMLFSVGHVRDPALEYIVAGGNLQDRSLYFWSEYSSVSDLVRLSLLLPHLITPFRLADSLCYTRSPPSIPTSPPPSPAPKPLTPKSPPTQVLSALNTLASSRRRYVRSLRRRRLRYLRVRMGLGIRAMCWCL